MPALQWGWCRFSCATTLVLLLLVLAADAVHALGQRENIRLVTIDESDRIQTPCQVRVHGRSLSDLSCFFHEMVVNVTPAAQLDVVSGSGDWYLPFVGQRSSPGLGHVGLVLHWLRSWGESDAFTVRRFSPVAQPLLRVSGPREALVSVTEELQPLRVACFAAGAMLLLLAPRLSRATAFHLASGAVVGVLASLLLMVFLFGRRVRGRHIAALTIGISTVWWAALTFWRDVLLNPVFLGYASLGAVIGAAWIYKRPFDQRDTSLLLVALRAGIGDRQACCAADQAPPARICAFGSRYPDTAHE